MAKQLFSNNGQSSVANASGLAIGDTTLTLPAGEGQRFQSPTAGDYELVTLSDGVNIEIVKVTARSSDDLTIVRAQEGTSAAAFALGTSVYAAATKGTFDNIQTQIDDLVTEDANLQGQIDTLGTTDASLQNQIDTNDTNLQAQIDGITGSSIPDLQGQINANTALINALASTILIDQNGNVLTDENNVLTK